MEKYIFFNKVLHTAACHFSLYREFCFFSEQIYKTPTRNKGSSPLEVLLF